MWAHRLVLATIPRLPKFVHPPIAVLTALIFFVLLNNERRAVIANLSHVCGGGRSRLLWKTYRVFYSFCDFVVSYCYVPRASHGELRAMLTDSNRGADKIDACLAKGNGLVVWTAHLGNWEFASRLLEMPERRVNVARVVERDKPAEAMLRELMENHLLHAVDLNEGVAASIKLLAALRANEIVAIQGDRVYQGFSAEMPFFGATASFPLGPFFLAYVSGAPVLPGFVVRDGWLRYRVIMGEPIELPQTGDRDCDLRSGLRQAVLFLEENVRKYYDQWLNFFEFWAAAAHNGRDV
jgi:predicted LPLAT superfamily acyltransferase